jgi:hypothetical protein
MYYTEYYIMPTDNEVKWLPVFSFLGILAILFFVASLYSPKLGGIVVGAVVGTLSTISGLIPEHYRQLKKVWFEKMLTSAHLTFVAIASITIMVISFLLVKNYKIDIDISKKPT